MKLIKIILFSIFVFFQVQLAECKEIEKFKENLSLEEKLNYAMEVAPTPWQYEKFETSFQRSARLKNITIALLLEAPIAKGLKGGEWGWSIEDLVWATYNKTYYESGRFDVNVHNGNKRGDHQKSVCLGQIMFRRAFLPEANLLVGTDLLSTRRCIASVMSHLILHQIGCKKTNAEPSIWSMGSVYMSYGSGKSCRADRATPRRDANGDVLLIDGKIIYDQWALTRAKTWWMLRSGIIPWKIKSKTKIKPE